MYTDNVSYLDIFSKQMYTFITIKVDGFGSTPI